MGQLRMVSFLAHAELFHKNDTNTEETIFVSLLKTCTKKKDLHEGRKLHSDILRRGLLERSPYIASTLINMYAKCGKLSDAQEVHDELHIREVVTWNTLISGHTNQGHGREALQFHERMYNESICPNDMTLSSVLKACGNIKAVDKSKKFHCYIINRNLLENMVLGNALVDMYSRCGFFARAEEVLDEIPGRNVVSWSALIRGYSESGKPHEALNRFEQMRYEGLVPDEMAFTCALKACGNTRSIEKGKQLHEEIIARDMLVKNIMLGTALVDMYAKCRLLLKAYKLHDGLPFRDVVSWNALIAGYVEEEQYFEALDCYERMQREGTSPDAVTFICILKACGSRRDIERGRHIHEKIVAGGFLEKNLVLSTALIDMYAKCGLFDRAEKVLDELPVRSEGSFSALIAGYAQTGQGQKSLDCLERMHGEGFFPDVVTLVCVLKACGDTGAAARGKQIHDEITARGLLDRNVMLGTALVDMYAKCGMLERAQEVFEQLPHRNIVSWNALIAGLVKQGQFYKAINCFQLIQSEGLAPDTITFISVLGACSIIGALYTGRQLHEEIVAQRLLQENHMLGNSLVDMYAKCGMLEKAQQMHNELALRNVTSWSALIAGYSEQGCAHEALNCFERLQAEGLSPDAVIFACTLKACGNTGALYWGTRVHNELASRGLLTKNLVLGNALVDMYVKCGLVAKALQILYYELPLRDIVSWSAVIAGYAEQGQGYKALDCFEQMRMEGISPDAVTFTCILKACGSTGAIEKGKQIHEEVSVRGFLKENVILGSALVDMYVKCGEIARAQNVHNCLSVRNIVSWNTLIAGYAKEGQHREAQHCFEQLQRDGILPDAVTFICLLNACSHSGRSDIVETYFECMIRKYGVLPNFEHVTCMIVAFGREGRLDKAMAVIETMKFSEYLPLWVALLSACRKWGNTLLGKFVFDQAVQIDTNCC